MEKFGIFELLDALSAISASENGDLSAAETESAPVDPPADLESPADPARSPSSDTAFAPPVYGGYQGVGRGTESSHAGGGADATEKKTSVTDRFPPREDEPTALSSLLERHEKMKRNSKR